MNSRLPPYGSVHVALLSYDAIHNPERTLVQATMDGVLSSENGELFFQSVMRNVLRVLKASGCALFCTLC